MLTRIEPLVLVRLSLALFLTVHGWARLLAGGVVPFGGWLDSLGFPGGVIIAGGITALEILLPPLLAFRKFVLPISAWFVVQLLTGIVLVHAPNGWFVVGLSRNGMEYSVFLMLMFAAVVLGELKGEPESA